MIAEYKLYHGAVLAELVDLLPRAVSINELDEEGRLSSYILDGRVGLQVKHSTQRLHPWQFTFTKSNGLELLSLSNIVPEVFVVLVCHTDGMACLTIREVTSILAAGESDQAWIRVDRRRNEMYTVSGAACELSSKKPNGIDPIVSAIMREPLRQADKTG